MDVTGEVATAVGIKQMHDNWTPKDMQTVPQYEGQPYRMPNFLAKKCLRPTPQPDMALPDREGFGIQGRYNQGTKNPSGPVSNTISVNGLSPMVIAQAVSNRRQVVLRPGGAASSFTSKTTTNAIEAERDTVLVEPNTLEEVTEVVSVYNLLLVILNINNYYNL